MAVKTRYGHKFCYSSFFHILKMDKMTVLLDLGLNGTSGVYKTICFRKFQELVYYADRSNLTPMYPIFP
jgi:hypothetical protein